MCSIRPAAMLNICGTHAQRTAVSPHSFGGVRMTRTFVELPSFQSAWKSLGLTDKDLRRLQEELLADPEVGKIMRETGGIRKMRFAFENRGKSGSIRIIYVDFEVYEKLYLLTAYPKNEKDNLTKSERNQLKKLVENLEHRLAEQA